MPTLEEARRLADDFEREYPETLPDQLAWWAKVLGVSRGRMLRLISLSYLDFVLLKQRHRSWTMMVRARANRAVWVNELLLELLSRYSYDWAALAKDLKRIRARRKVAASLRSRPLLVNRLGSQLPHRPPRPVPQSRKGDGHRDEELIRTIWKGGQQARDALQEFLTTG